MTKSEKIQMKSIIKPLIKECLRDIMVEEGLIRMLQEHTINENKKIIDSVTKNPQKTVNKFVNETTEQKKQEYKQQIAESVKVGIGAKLFNPFEGTESIDVVEAKQQEGVDISKFFNS